MENKYPQEIKQKFSTTQAEFYSKLNTFLLAGFSFVAGLAWNDAIQTLFGYVWPEKGGSIAAKFIYAIFVTLVLTVVAMRLGKKSGTQN